MPLYELTLIPKPFAKKELVDVMARFANILLDKGAVIARIESLGHRDLPFVRMQKSTGARIKHSNYFLFRSYLTMRGMSEAQKVLKNDRDLLFLGIVNDNDHTDPPETCTLEEHLKVPSHRQAVVDLRNSQKIGHFPRQRIFKRIEKEFKAVPKAYPVSPRVK
ncbi:ribosomal protein s6 domain-containing protein [Ditylenchus destructor]|nr:ribosomal protein s6 domain-containing protein [Ditylenchus destructor]